MIKIKTSEYVPIEIQEEILKRLPLKPLIQFRSVSKLWKRLIDSPDFMVSYAVRHPQPDRFILRYALPDYDHIVEDQYVFFVDNDDENDNDHNGFVQQDIVPTIPDLIKRIESSSSVVGSSHGLVCFVGGYEYPDDDSSGFDDLSEFDGTKMVVLWNPSIRKSVGIPVPEMYESPYDDYEIDDVIGFGVCPVTLDPTIIKIKFINRKMNEMPDISAPWIVRVFTLSTGTWSVLSTNLPRESIGLSTGLSGRSQIVIDRFIFWLAYDYMLLDAESQSHFLIISFDLIAKEFKEINLPDSPTNGLREIETISKLRECLVLLEFHRDYETDLEVCCLWMMKKQGISESFTKLYTINLPDTTVNTLLGCRKTGALILETRQDYENNAEVQLYEPNSEAIENLEIHGVDNTFSMCSYKDSSLLLVDQLDGYIYPISH
uniref:F-box/kelch-repeat protein At3g23880-like n=1 Tax=Erigeron canadensis TaxID=72917 RepID=UPI001CB9D0D5|nr:F-box/kelch-repeat protein At3g23880-like [Erigeron canadensis]XP_043631224.1 F-box/kelch-repeat protein At3g23880-like [Erigeron canadensis]XP_043631225.1 F-box/kelch-repeat protein At3g23880-like [Erigeron canadensis]XP_043631226.1 F-box/kelch-repeat protein At3g23880-like [Erigeron canadensis]